MSPGILPNGTPNRPASINAAPTITSRMPNPRTDLPSSAIAAPALHRHRIQSSHDGWFARAAHKNNWLAGVKVRSHAESAGAPLTALYLAEVIDQHNEF